MTGLILGVDGGQTSTRLMVANWEGEILWQTRVASATSGPINNQILNIRHRLGNIFREALSIAGLEHVLYEIAILGMSGAEMGSPFITEYKKAAINSFDAKRYLVVHDVLTNLMGASSGKPGVVVIAGGGSIAYGLTADGRSWTSNGWGYAVGDEGSGFVVGRTAINAIFRAIDGRGAPTRLAEYLFPQLHVSTAVDLKYAIFQGTINFEDIAKLAPWVAKAAIDGDITAQSILNLAGTEIADSTIAVVNALYENPGQVDIYPTGGLFQEISYFLPAFRMALLSSLPDACIYKPTFEPVVGAIILGIKELGYEINEKRLSNLSKVLYIPSVGN